VIVQTVTSNKKGFTLLELMVAIVIMTVGLLGLLATTNLAIETNTRNYLRDEAVRVGERLMSATVNQGYVNTVPGVTNQNVPVNFRSAAINYAATTTVTQLPSSRQIDVQLAWTYKNHNYAHSVSSIIGP
jgi:type IV pilus assembly protein PilV